MSALSYAERLARLDRAIETNEIQRGQWIACLLSQLSPEVERDEDPGACPASLMPSWLAYLTPSINDNGSLDAWPSVVHRYASLAHRWPGLALEEWQRAHYRVLVVTVTEGMRHTTDDRCTGACQRVISLLTCAASGETISRDQWEAEAERAAAATVWSTAAWSDESAAALAVRASWAARAASWAAWAAAAAAGAASWAAAEKAAAAAAGATSWAAAEKAVAAAAADAKAGASSVKAAWAASDAAAETETDAEAEKAWEVAWDRMIDGWFDVIDNACTDAEEAG